MMTDSEMSEQKLSDVAQHFLIFFFKSSVVVSLGCSIYDAIMQSGAS